MDLLFCLQIRSSSICDLKMCAFPRHDRIAESRWEQLPGLMAGNHVGNQLDRGYL